MAEGILALDSSLRPAFNGAAKGGRKGCIGNVCLPCLPYMALKGIEPWGAVSARRRYAFCEREVFFLFGI